MSVEIGQSLTSFFNGMMSFLVQTSSDPILYSFVLFIYAILAAVILPIPVEVGLLLSPNTPFLWLAFVLGLGKMVGSILVFYFGLGVGDKIKIWSGRWNWFRWLVTKSEWIVDKLHYVGLYLILSLPLMSDTIPLYIFSMLNENGIFKVKWFALVNLCAGFTRATVLFALLSLFGINLFH